MKQWEFSKAFLPKKSLSSIKGELRIALEYSGSEGPFRMYGYIIDEKPTVGELCPTGIAVSSNLNSLRYTALRFD